MFSLSPQSKHQLLITYLLGEDFLPLLVDAYLIVQFASRCKLASNLLFNQVLTQESFPQFSHLLVFSQQ
jgi:hypothetical protein